MAMQQALLMIGGGLQPFSFNSFTVTLPSTQKWAACAYDQASSRFCLSVFDNASAKAAYSTDYGASWTESTPTAGRRWSNLARLPGTGFSMVVDNANPSLSNYGSGASWTASNLSTSLISYGDLVYDGGSLLLIPVFGTNSSETSSDSVTWTTGGTLPKSGPFRNLAAINTPSLIAVATPNDSTAVGAYSTDRGANWSNSTFPSAETSWAVGDNGTGNVNNSPRFMAVALGGTATAYSDDGVNWTSGGALPATRNWTAVCYCINSWIALAYNTDKGAYSTDGGANWTEITFAATIPTGLSDLHPGDTNGQLYRCIVPLYDTDDVLVITTA